MSDFQSRPSPVFVASRVILGFAIFSAGLGKALDVPGFVAVMHSYHLNFLPGWSYWPGALGVILFELLLGMWMLTHWKLGIAFLLSIGMHFGYLVLLTSSLLRGLHLQNCGCFGVFLARPLTWVSPIEDLGLIIVSWGLYALARRDAASILQHGVAVDEHRVERSAASEEIQ